jgi:hypothetical protein
MRLEQLGRISRHNFYQDILNAIALDIRTKSRRRVQRQRELEGVRLTLGNLGEKAEWLESQRKSYDNYIEQAMMTLQKKGYEVSSSIKYNANSKTERSDSSCHFRSSTTTRKNSNARAGNLNSDLSNTQRALFRTKESLSRGRGLVTENGTKSTSQFPVTKSVSSSLRVAKEASRCLAPVLKFRWIHSLPLSLQITSTWTCSRGV